MLDAFAATGALRTTSVPSLLDPVWLAVIVPTALVLLGWGGNAVYRRRAARAAARPCMVFGPVSLLGPGETTRTAYRFALGFRLANDGPGAALHLVTFAADPKDEVYAEVMTRPRIDVGGELYVELGLRLEDQQDDPTLEQAEAMLHRCVCFASCWDRHGDTYTFFPLGGGRSPLPWKTPREMYENAGSNPSRGERRRSLGIGDFFDGG